MISCLIIRPPRMILQKISGHFCQFWNPWARMMASNFRRKFPPKFCKTLPSRLPLEDGSVRPQTLGKRVSDDSQHFIFRRRKHFFGKIFWWKFSSKKKIVGKSTNCLFLRSYGFLDVIGRCASKSYPQSFDFQLSTTFGGGVKEIVSIFAPDFRPKMTSRLLVFWLEDTCVPDDKISAAWWLVGS